MLVYGENRFSNGCDIGCDTCDGATGQKIPCCNTKFEYVGNGSVSSWGGEDLVPTKAWLESFDRDKADDTHMNLAGLL